MTNPKDIANNFNKHFIEIGRNLASQIPDPCSGESFDTFMSRSTSKFKLQKVEESKVLKLLTTADSGYDKIPNKLLKIAAPYIIKT